MLPIIHPIIVLIDDVFAWFLGKNGVPWYITFPIIFIILYFFWNPIITTIKKGLSLIGLK